MSSFHFILFILFYFIALIVFICLVFYLRPFYSLNWYLVLHFAYLLSLFQLFKFFFTLSKFYYYVYVWVGHTVGVCVCVFLCEQKAHQPTPQHFSRAWNLSPSRKSLSLVPVDPIRLCLSAIFQLVSSVWSLIFGSFEAEKERKHKRLCVDLPRPLWEVFQVDSASQRL